MAHAPNITDFSAYLSVGEAAKFLGVSASTLRNWDRQGKLSPRRHPINGYRLYVKSELERLLRKTKGQDGYRGE